MATRIGRDLLDAAKAATEKFDAKPLSERVRLLQQAGILDANGRLAPEYAPAASVAARSRR